jgi:cytochrome c556
MAQLMRGTLYPASNVIFAAQDQNPADVPRAKDPNMATDLLTSSYGKWEAVENSALAIAEVAKFVEELRDAGMKAYTAAQSKDQDKVIAVTDVMTLACQHCHVRYRERRAADRCK